MAAFTSSIMTPNGNGLGLDLFEFDVNSFQDYLFSSFSLTVYRLFDDADNEVLFGGSGLVQDPGSGAITGSITSFVFRKAGVVQLSATGLNVDANVLQTAIETGDSYYFLSLLAAGNDTFTGTALNDNLWFDYNDGNDTMNGGNGNDSIYGGFGTDILNGQADSDYLVGGTGQDIIDGGSTFTNGENFDSVGYTEEYLFGSGTEGIIVNFSGVTQGALLNNQVSDAFGEIDTVTNIEEILGTGFDDIVYAPQNVSDFRFKGYSGSDTYFGATTSFDVLDYSNDERFAVQANLQVGLALVASGITVNFSADNVVDNGSSGTIIDSFGDTDTAVSVDQIRGTFFNDVYNGGVDNDYFRGLKGNDIFYGNGGFDVSSYAQDQRGNGVQAGGLGGITANFASDMTADGVSIGTVVDGFGTTDNLNSVERIEGTDFADTLFGGVDRVEFWAGQGADTAVGSFGDIYFDGNGNVAGESDTFIFGEASTFYKIIDRTSPGGPSNYIFYGNDGSIDEVLDVENFVFTNGTLTSAQLNIFAPYPSVPPRTVIFTTPSVSFAEGDSGTTSFNFTILLDAAAFETMQVSYFVLPFGMNGASPLDFSSQTTGTVTFERYETSKSFTILVSGDTDFEQDETFQVFLNPMNSPNLQIGNNSIVTVTIVNDDMNVINGDAADNILNGTSGLDQINGLGGDDIIDGGTGFDTVSGGAGDDRLVIGARTVGDLDVVSGGAGRDVIDLSGMSSAVWVDLEYTAMEVWTSGLNFAFGGNANTQVANLDTIENIIGTIGSDTVLGDGLDNLYKYTGHTAGTAENFQGRGGSDTIDVSALSSVWVDLNRPVYYTNIFTSGGNESFGYNANTAVVNLLGVENIIGTAGSDVIYGDGQDNYFKSNGVSNTGGVLPVAVDYFNGGSGSDTIDLSSLNYTGAVWVDLAYAGSQVWLSKDILSATSNNANTYIATLDGVENVVGTVNTDQFFGDGSNNTYFFNGFNGTQTEVFDGRGGNDTFDTSLSPFALWVALNYPTMEVWTNNSTVNLATGANSSTAVANLVSVENLVGSQFSDTLIGDVNANIIEGGKGNDVLVGGLGGDTFVYNFDLVNYASMGADQINDFTAGSAVGHDVIQLSGISSSQDTFAELMLSTYNTAQGVSIQFFDGGSIDLLGVVKAQLTADDFVFV
jgi:Ca2+-binding RTX toxin-like protein